MPSYPFFSFRTVTIAGIAVLATLVIGFLAKKPAASPTKRGAPAVQYAHGNLIDPQASAHCSEIRGTIAPNSTFTGALTKAGIPSSIVDSIHRVFDSGGFDFTSCRPGQEFCASLDSAGSLRSFRYVFDRIHSYWIHRTKSGGLTVFGEQQPVQSELVSIEGAVETSVYQAVMAMGEKPDVVAAYAEVLGYSVDFIFDPRPGDRFRILIEKRILHGEIVGYGQLIAAEFDGKISGKALAYRFDDTASKTAGWYAPDGENTQRLFMRSPLSILNVTSAFGMRKHPISGRHKMHTGIDYGAPTGTPVWAVGSGVVSHAGRRGGYGNLIELTHPGGIKTRYGHLSKVLVKRGSAVRQHQVIGKVGSTGYSTGPHLHFEFLVNGVFAAPQRVKNPPLKRIPEAAMKRFAATVDSLNALWQTAARERTSEPIAAVQ